MISVPRKKPGPIKPNAKGRNSDPQGRFVRLGHDLLSSKAYRSLTPNARALLVELVSLYNGKNNGEFWLSETDAARRIGISCPKIARNAFSELDDSGFIAMTKDAYFNIKTGVGRARQWRLTWQFNNAERKSATNEWRLFEPTSDKAVKRMNHGLRALETYRKKSRKIQNTQGNLPCTLLILPTKQGELLGTKKPTDEIPVINRTIK